MDIITKLTEKLISVDWKKNMIDVQNWAETDDGKRIMKAIYNHDKTLLYTEEEKQAYEAVVKYQEENGKD